MAEKDDNPILTQWLDKGLHLLKELETLVLGPSIKEMNKTLDSKNSEGPHQSEINEKSLPMTHAYQKHRKNSEEAFVKSILEISVNPPNNKKKSK